MKRSIILFFLLAVVSIVSAQGPVRNKQQTRNQKTSEQKIVDQKKSDQKVLDQTNSDRKASDQKTSDQKASNLKAIDQKALVQKTAVLKDTIKKSKIAVEIQEKKIDSLVKVLDVFKPFKKDAHASYYADKFNGKRTTSGSRFDNDKYTAAHKKLPFGTKVRVTNEKNGKSVVVEITDRGPFVKSREIDLSKRAYMEITSNKGSGGMLVTIEVLSN